MLYVSLVELFDVYDHPSEFPEYFAVRKLKVADDGLRGVDWLLFQSLEAARSMLAQLGLIRVPGGDQPRLVETWV